MTKSENRPVPAAPKGMQGIKMAPIAPSRPAILGKSHGR